MNALPLPKKLLILSSLVEGASIRSIERISGVHRDTIMRLLHSSGEQASEILDREMTGLQSKYIQVDEIWTYVAKKQKTLSDEERLNPELGDQYVFIALDAETKLVPLFRVGKREGKLAYSFLRDLQARVATRFQLSTDAFAPYYEAVDSIWGIDIDNAQIHKHYREENTGERRYSPPCVVSVTKRSLIGEPNYRHISTSYVERQNLTIRMQNRRFTRLTNAFSKKLDNLKGALALHFFHYNFMRIHQSLRVTPAMQAGISRHVWTWEEFLGIQQRQTKVA